MSRIVFKNAGVINERLITTLGVNVKDSDSAIGYFGTGLKYAIAVLVRENQSIEITSGKAHWQFGKSVETIRGKEFEFISMLNMHTGKESQLGFTTEFGKNWSLENAYRELHCNCIDEGGLGGEQAEQRSITGAIFVPDGTCISVTGEQFFHIHSSRYSFLLDPARTLIFEQDGLQVFAGNSNRIFYKGIAVCKLSRESQFCYNLVSSHQLTEDRTMSSVYCESQLSDIFTNPKEQVPGYFFDTLTKQNSFEKDQVPWYAFYQLNDKAFTEIQRLVKKGGSKLSPAVEDVFYRELKRRDGDLSYEECELTKEQKAKLATAVKFWKDLGYSVGKYPIKVAKHLGENTLALAVDGKYIWLTLQLLEGENHILRQVLLEEYIHCNYGVKDFSREFQDVCFNIMVNLGERVLEKKK